MRCEDCGRPIPFGEAIGHYCADCWIDTEGDEKMNYEEKPMIMDPDDDDECSSCSGSFGPGNIVDGLCLECRELFGLSEDGDE